MKSLDEIESKYIRLEQEKVVYDSIVGSNEYLYFVEYTYNSTLDVKFIDRNSQYKALHYWVAIDWIEKHKIWEMRYNNYELYAEDLLFIFWKDKRKPVEYEKNKEALDFLYFLVTTKDLSYFSENIEP